MARAKRVRCIDVVHDVFDPIADRRNPLIGGLKGLNLQGTFFYMVHRGPYAKLGQAWENFWEKFAEQDQWEMAGAPGDVYVCVPEAHAAERQESLLTVLWCPVSRKKPSPLAVRTRTSTAKKGAARSRKRKK